MKNSHKYTLYIGAFIVFVLIVVSSLLVPRLIKNHQKNSTSNTSIKGNIQNMPILTLDDVNNNEKFNLITNDANKYKLIFFGYTNCPDICPTTLSNLTEALYGGKISSKQADKFEIIFITIDPKRDTKEKMKNWLTLFSPKIIGLIPTEEQINTIKEEWHIAVYPNNDVNELYKDNTMKEDHHMMNKESHVPYTRGNLAHSSYIFISKGDTIIDITSDNSVNNLVKLLNSSQFN